MALARASAGAPIQEDSSGTLKGREGHEGTADSSWDIGDSSEIQLLFDNFSLNNSSLHYKLGQLFRVGFVVKGPCMVHAQEKDGIALTGLLLQESSYNIQVVKQP